MSDQNEPATKQELADVTAHLTTTLASKGNLAKLASKDDLAATVAKLASKDDLAAMEKRLVLAIRHGANVMIEQIRTRFAAIMEKYDGPLHQVPTDLDAHRADFSLHMRPAPSAPKRTRRSKSLRRH